MSDFEVPAAEWLSASCWEADEERKVAANGLDS